MNIFKRKTPPPCAKSHPHQLLTTSKRAPHNWITPELGDDVIKCADCGRTIHYLDDLTNSMKNAIVKGLRNRDRHEAARMVKWFFAPRWEKPRRR